MTIPGPGDSPTGLTEAADLELLQALDDCRKLVDCSPVTLFARGDIHSTGTRLADLLDSMLSSGAAERRLHDASRTRP